MLLVKLSHSKTGIFIEHATRTSLFWCMLYHFDGGIKEIGLFYKHQCYIEFFATEKNCI